MMASGVTGHAICSLWCFKALLSKSVGSDGQQNSSKWSQRCGSIKQQLPFPLLCDVAEWRGAAAAPCGHEIICCTNKTQDESRVTFQRLVLLRRNSWRKIWHFIHLKSPHWITAEFTCIHPVCTLQLYDTSVWSFINMHLNQNYCHDMDVHPYSLHEWEDMSHSARSRTHMLQRHGQRHGDSSVGLSSCPDNFEESPPPFQLHCDILAFFLFCLLLFFYFIIKLLKTNEFSPQWSNYKCVKGIHIRHFAHREPFVGSWPTKSPRKEIKGHCTPTWWLTILSYWDQWVTTALCVLYHSPVC